MSATAEKYARAIRSSHLEMKVEPSDVDTLIAAGLVHDGIGTSLLRLRAERDSISKLRGSRLMIGSLRSMAGTRALLVRHASQYSNNYGEESIELRAIVQKVLDLFLDPNCDPCGGTGKVGVYGSHQPMCPACGGATKRRAMWQDNETEALADWLCGQMESKVDTALRKIQRLLRQT